MTKKIENKSKKDGFGVNGNLTAGGPGRPKGQRNYSTIYREALTKLAEVNDKTPEDLEDEIVQKALAAARSGDYRFYKDLLDRLHGTPQQRVDHTTDGKPLQISTEIAAKHKLNEATRDTS